MKLAILALALGASLFAANPTFMVHYQTTEPCYECGARYAVGCFPSTPDCGVPTKQVDHYETFSTRVAAMNFVNSGFPARVARIEDAGTMGFYPHQPARASKLVAIYEATPVKLKVTEYAVEQTQPVTVEKRIRVEEAQ